jgi:hypothetical protein
VFSWLRSHSSREDVIAAPFDSMTYLYTGRVSFRPYVLNTMSAFYGADYPVLGTIEEFQNALKGYKARYLVTTPMPGYLEEAPYSLLLREFLEHYPGRATPAFVGSDPRFAIFELTR